MSVLSIYDSGYAAVYPSLYLHPWREKHILNVANLKRIFEGSAAAHPRWLDIACGQAWHFTQFPDSIYKVGLDLSLAQLTAARQQNRRAQLIQADMRSAVFGTSQFDVVTCFWAAYCYLDSHALIREVVSRAVGWIKEGGSLYIEVLQPEDLSRFNESKYSDVTGFTVIPRSPDYQKWSYKDTGGLHLMTSPRLGFFLRTLAEAFEQVTSKHDSRFMVHLIAEGRRA